MSPRRDRRSGVSMRRLRQPPAKEDCTQIRQMLIRVFARRRNFRKRFPRLKAEQRGLRSLSLLRPVSENFPIEARARIQRKSRQRLPPWYSMHKRAQLMRSPPARLPRLLGEAIDWPFFLLLQ